jgi:hypothetical protein
MTSCGATASGDPDADVIPGSEPMINSCRAMLLRLSPRKHKGMFSIGPWCCSVMVRMSASISVVPLGRPAVTHRHAREIRQLVNAGPIEPAELDAVEHPACTLTVSGIDR